MIAERRRLRQHMAASSSPVVIDSPTGRRFRRHGDCAHRPDARGADGESIADGLNADLTAVADVRRSVLSASRSSNARAWINASSSASLSRLSSVTALAWWLASDSRSTTRPLRVSSTNTNRKSAVSRDRFTSPSVASRRIAPVMAGAPTRSTTDNFDVRMGPWPRRVNRIDSCATVKSPMASRLLSRRCARRLSAIRTRCSASANSVTSATVGWPSAMITCLGRLGWRVGDH